MKLHLPLLKKIEIVICCLPHFYICTRILKELGPPNAESYKVLVLVFNEIMQTTIRNY